MSENSESTQSAPAKSAGSSNNMMVGVLTVLLVFALGAAVFFWNESRDSEPSAEEIAAQNQAESAEVINALDMILLTEGDEAPTVARVEQPQLLKDANPEFYKNVEEGDYLVLYPQRAIVFRLGDKRVINVAPIIDTTQFSTDGTEPAEEGEDGESTDESTDESQ